MTIRPARLAVVLQSCDISEELIAEIFTRLKQPFPNQDEIEVEQVSDYLEKLSPEQRTILRLRLLEHKSRTFLAVALSRTISQVRTRESRAIQVFWQAGISIEAVAQYFIEERQREEEVKRVVGTIELAVLDIADTEFLNAASAEQGNN